VTVDTTSLSDEETAQALECMLAAIDGTSFEIQPLDEMSATLTFYQDWTVSNQ